MPTLMQPNGAARVAPPSLRRNLVANFVSQAWNAVMGLAFVPMYVEYMGLESYGLVGAFAALQSWLGLLDMGMKPTLSREMARFEAGIHSPDQIRDLLRTFEVLAAAVAVAVASFAVVGAPWISEHWFRVETLPVAQVSRAFSVIGVVTGARFVEGLYASCLVGLQRQVALNTIVSAAATLRGLGAVAALAFVSPTIEVFFTWQAAVGTLSLITTALITYRALPAGTRPARASREAVRGVWRFAGGMLGVTIVTLLLTQIDKVVLMRLLTLTDYGRYSLAGVAAGSLLMLGGPITQAWSPRLSALQAKGEEGRLGVVYHQGAQLVSVLVGSTAIMLCVFAEPVLFLWTRDAELASRAGPILSLLAIGNLMNGLMWMPYHTQLAHGWTSMIVGVNTVSVAVVLPALWWAAPRFGPSGAAAVWMGTNLINLLVAVPLMHRRILRGELLRFYTLDTVLPLAAAASVALVARFVVPLSGSRAIDAIVLGLTGLCVLGSGALAAPLLRGQIVALTRRGHATK